MSTATEVSNAANLNMAANLEQQNGADADEVMPEMERRGGAEREKSREIAVAALRPEAPSESSESQRRRRPAVACVSGAAAPGGYAAESA